MPLVLLLALPTLAETVEADTTWEGTRELTEEVVVAEGVTLTVLPGAELRLDEGVDLRVQGTLVARGTAEEPIALVGLDGARWGSVILEPTASDAEWDEDGEWVAGSVVEQVHLDGGAQALVIEGCSPWVHASTFRDNAYTPELSRAGAALLVTEGSRALVQGNLFEDNEVGGSGHGGAVYVDRADPALQGNTFRGNRSAYGGALVTSLAYGPVVGNTFEGNRGEWEGGAIALVSSALVLANNTITDNESILDGGGVHVCVTCDPHANPAVVDNHITGNRNTGFGAAGLGAAYLRALSGNDLHDNTQDGAPADLAWHNEHLDLDPAWAHSPSFSGNWWGTTDAQAIEQTIHDGLDEDGLGVVGVAPADGPVAEPRTRAFAIPQKIRFTEGDTMPVYLTLYNPGPAREVELLLMVSYEDGPPLPWTGALAGAEVDGDRWRLELAEDEVRFAELTAPELHTDAPRSGAWIAVLFDPDTGERLAEPATGRFELGGGR